MVKYNLGTLYPLDIKEESIKQMTMENFHFQDHFIYFLFKKKKKKKINIFF